MKLHETFIIILDYVMEKQKKHAILLTHYIISKSRAKCKACLESLLNPSLFWFPITTYGEHTHTRTIGGGHRALANI